MRKRALFTTILTVCLSVAPAIAQDYNHIEIGAYADWFNLSRTTPNINYAGLGGRVGFNVRPTVQIEAEMAYDFERNFTSTFSDGINTQFVRSHVRPLHAFFGPKFQTSGGPFRAFAAFKVGLLSFSTSNDNVPAGFIGGLGAVTEGNTRAALLPSVGVEGFWGPIGLRLDGGDEIYFDHGARHNVRVTFGPAIRF